jgi:ferredoxin
MDLYKSLEKKEEITEEEEDMLDMAFGLTETSRLGCQIIVTNEMNGMTLEMPKATRNFYVDGHVAKPH